MSDDRPVPATITPSASPKECVLGRSFITITIQAPNGKVFSFEAPPEVEKFMRENNVEYE